MNMSMACACFNISRGSNHAFDTVRLLKLVNISTKNVSIQDTAKCFYNISSKPHEAFDTIRLLRVGQLFHHVCEQQRNVNGQFVVFHERPRPAMAVFERYRV